MRCLWTIIFFKPIPSFIKDQWLYIDIHSGLEADVIKRSTNNKDFVL